MKKMFILLAIAMFLSTAAFAFDLPRSRSVVPNTDSYNYLGKNMVTQTMQSNGTISMKGYQKGNIQFITMTFDREARPYCWWYADVNSGASKGRCDINNDEIYEYDFDSTSGRSGRVLYFKPFWPTAYD